MSKAEDEVISVMSETEWLSLPQIIEKAKLKGSTTRVTVCRLAIQERITKREKPDGTMLYKRGFKSGGFGISRNMSDLDQLLRTVRPS